MKQLKEIFSKVLGIPEEAVVPGLSSKNTPSWDSLNEIVLVTEIEKAFKLKFDYDEALSIRTFADAAALLRSKGVKLQ